MFEVEIASPGPEKLDLLTAPLRAILDSTSIRRLLRNSKFVYALSFVNVGRGVSYLSLIPSSEHAMTGLHPLQFSPGPSAGKISHSKSPYRRPRLLRALISVKCGFDSGRGRIEGALSRTGLDGAIIKDHSLIRIPRKCNTLRSSGIWTG